MRILHLSTCLLCAVAFCALGAARFRVSAAPVPTAGLYGITEPIGNEVFLVSINPNTGNASAFATFTVNPGFLPQHLAYHFPSGNFITRNGGAPGAAGLGILDPVSETLTEVLITGLPAGEEGAQGLDYQQSEGRILITFGVPGSNLENRIAEIGLNGAVLNVSPDLLLGDRDDVAANPATGDLLAIDANGSPAGTGTNKYVVVGDPFGLPTTLTIADPAAQLDFFDVAISPQGRFFWARASELVEFDLGPDTYSTIGPFNIAATVSGIAFVPEATSFATFLAGLVGLLAYCWRRRGRA